MVLDRNNYLKLFHIFLPFIEDTSEILFDESNAKYNGRLDSFGPDIFRPNGRISQGTDIFHFGKIAYEILFGRPLYSSKDFKDDTEFCSYLKALNIGKKIHEGNLLLKAPICTLLEHLISSCLSFHKDKRPKIE